MTVTVGKYANVNIARSDIGKTPVEWALVFSDVIFHGYVFMTEPS